MDTEDLDFNHNEDIINTISLHGECGICILHIQQGFDCKVSHWSLWYSFWRCMHTVPIKSWTVALYSECAWYPLGAHYLDIISCVFRCIMCVGIRVKTMWILRRLVFYGHTRCSIHPELRHIFLPVSYLCLLLIFSIENAFAARMSIRPIVWG